MGLPYADTQWQVPDTATTEEKNWARKGFSWQTRLWIDDMFMITIIQSQAYKATGKREYIDRAAREMVMYLNSNTLTVYSTMPQMFLFIGDAAMAGWPPA